MQDFKRMWTYTTSIKHFPKSDVEVKKLFYQFESKYLDFLDGNKVTCLKKNHEGVVKEANVTTGNFKFHTKHIYDQIAHFGVGLRYFDESNGESFHVLMNNAFDKAKRCANWKSQERSLLDFHNVMVHPAFWQKR